VRVRSAGGAFHDGKAEFHHAENRIGAVQENFSLQKIEFRIEKNYKYVFDL
jgi:hypothetical protein